MVTRILVLPGIGDIYWVAVALRDFARKHGIQEMEVAVWDFDGRRRSLEYVERIPFVKAAGYFVKPPHPGKLPEFRTSYLTGEQSVFPGLFGFDYYIAVNGALRTGKTVEEAMGCDTDWYFELRQTDLERVAQGSLRERHGPYIVCHFSDFGIFKPWVKAWGIEGCAVLLRRLHDATGCQMLLTGCDWDKPFSDAIAQRAGSKGVVSIAGDTTPDQFFGMMRGARGVIGWCGGNTILATALKKPTLIGWSQVCFPDRRFFHTACPPNAAHYHALTVERTGPRLAERAFLRLLHDTKVTE